MPKFDGQISAKYVETKPNEFFMIGVDKTATLDQK